MGCDGEQASNQFSGEYPSTDEARSIALKNFKPTKQDLEEEWAKKNAQNSQTKAPSEATG